MSQWTSLILQHSGLGEKNAQPCFVFLRGPQLHLEQGFPARSLLMERLCLLAHLAAPKREAKSKRKQGTREPDP